MRTKGRPRIAEYVIADREAGDGRANRHDLPRKLAAQDPPPRPADARNETAQERDRRAGLHVSLASVDVQSIDGGGVDLYEHLVVLRDGPLDFFESQDIRWPVPVVDNRSHGVCLTRAGCRRHSRYQAEKHPSMGRPASSATSSQPEANR